jgi:phospholipid N-methyltransferase
MIPQVDVYIMPPTITCFVLCIINPLELYGKLGLHRMPFLFVRIMGLSLLLVTLRSRYLLLRSIYQSLESGEELLYFFYAPQPSGSLIDILRQW